MDHHAAARRPVSWPYQVGVIPREAECYQGRAEAAAFLQEDVARKPQFADVVLTGMGGVGKTQLAAHYARNKWRSGDLDLLVWITANTRTAIVSGYSQAAVEILGADSSDPDGSAASFLAWLEAKSNAESAPTGCRWLVVLDDVTDPADVRGLRPPTANVSGTVLITTRRRDAVFTAGQRHVTEVGLFAPNEATSYLKRILAGQEQETEFSDAILLAEELGFLPLALSQAAAYILDAPGIDCASYLALLTDRARVLSELLPDSSALLDDQSVTVAAAWSLSIDRADDLRTPGLARPLLRFISMLASNGIPEKVFTVEPTLRYLSTARTGFARQEYRHDQVVETLRTLHRLNLIDYEPHNSYEAVRSHQLVQRSVRDGLSAGNREILARTCADSLAAAWPDIERNSTLSRSLRGNCGELWLNSSDSLFGSDMHPVLFLNGRSLGINGHYTDAADYFYQLSSTSRDFLGADHPDTLRSRHDSAYWRGESGDTERAMSEFTEVLRDRERSLGVIHRETVTTRHSLANVKGKAGDPMGAATTLEALLKSQSDFPHSVWDLIAIRLNLAHWRGEAGDASGAVDALSELLDEYARYVDPDHPEILIARNNLAHWKGESGDAAGASTDFEELLADRERVMGSDHPDTLLTRHNLARWRGEAGDAGGAASAVITQLPHLIRLLGEDHPQVLSARHNLANWQGMADDPNSAVVSYMTLLDDHFRVLGPDHPDTLKTKFNLAAWRGEAGDASGAAATFEELISEQLRVHGREHPQTILTRAALAFWRGESGDSSGAADAYAKLLCERRRILGDENVDTLTAWGRLAYWFGRSGDAAEAAKVTAEFLVPLTRALGPDHEEVMTAWQNLANCSAQLGDISGVTSATKQLAEIRRRVHGRDHPIVIETQTNLAMCMYEMGDVAGAVSELNAVYRTLKSTLGPEHPITLTALQSLSDWRRELDD